MKMSYAALGFLRRQYLCVLRRCAWFNAVMASSLACGFGGPALAQSIAIDGRTQTQVSVNGAVTDITTQTIYGINAYNSFTRFNVDAGNTVNLHLPGATSNLLNLVHGQQSYINGLVNSYKNGQIGGNVYFFNPHGIVVGSGGVLNVGSLTLATPTAAFMDRLIDPAGGIDAATTALALAGQIPLSQTGLVWVKGRIHAADAVALAAGTVDVAAGAQVLAGGRAQVAFADLVNVDGIASANQVQMDGGTIRIVAVEDIRVAGQVSADGVGAQADGGSVVVLAERDSTLAAGAHVSADAGDSGDGGFVEFSAKRNVALEGNGLSAHAAGGAAGEILIDPENLTWSGAGADVFSHGSNITITADKKVTLDNVMVSSRNLGAVADTRANHQSLASQGASGNINVTAKQIEIKNGSQLLAQGGNGFAAGAITIAATDNQSSPVFASLDDAIASVSIRNAVIKGGSVSIKATANDKYVWTGNEYGDTILDFLGSLRVGANLTFSTAHATIDVDDGTQIDAASTLDIEAQSIADASMKVMSTVVGFGYGETDSQARVSIGNATLGSGGVMSLKSQADSTLSVSVDTVNTGAFSNAASSASKYANLSFAVGIGNQVADVTVGNAATIDRASSLAVEASGKKEHGVAASGGSFKDGIASSGVSVLVSDTTLNASLGGNVSAGSVSVKAALADDAETSVSAAAGTAGSPDLQEAITSAKPVDEILFEKLSDFVAAAPTTDQRSGSSSKLGLSAAFAWVDNANSVTAEVADNTHVATPGALNVLAKAEESVSFETSAAVDQRDLDTQLPGDPNAPSDKKKIAISASVAVIDMAHHADARIGDGAVLSVGGALNVNSETVISPFWSQWDTLIDKFKVMDWNSASAWLDLGRAVYDVAGDPVNATSWTQTAVESEKLAFAGAVDFFSLDQKATAKIGNASINAGVTPITGAQDVNVSARSSHGILNLVGVPEFDPTSAPGSNSSSGSAGFGGSYHQFNLTGGSDAAIASGATVRADDVAVLADTQFDQVMVAETVGKAGKVSINGAFSLVDTDLHTVAQIGAGGSLDARDVLVRATDDSLLINVAGGVARSGSVGIGFSVAINELDREVRAIIGNRATESALGGTLTASGNVLLDAHASGTQGAFTVAGSGPAGADDPNATGGDGTQTNAKDSGQQGKSGVGISAAASVNLVNDTTAAGIADLASVTVSGGAPSSVEVDRDYDGVAETTISLARGLTAQAKNDTLELAVAGGLTVALDKSAGLAGAFTWNQLVKDTRATLSDATVTVNNGGVNLDAENTKAMWSVSASGAGGDKVGVAGSVSYSSIDNVTEAAIENANVDADSTVVLDAKDDSDIRSVAGAASYGGKAGIGAGVAISTVDSDTLARIDGGSVNGDAGVSATATNDNSIVSVAAALGASQGVAVSGSVTINAITNRTEASSSNALVTASGNAVNLDADDTADILSIAGSVAISTGQASVGIAAAYNEIDNETEARATGGTLSGNSIGIEATETATIGSYAVGGSGSAKAGVTGSLGINTIGNSTTASASGATLTTAGTAKVRAADTSAIESVTGAAAFGGNAAVGAAGSYNHIGGVVKAEISGGQTNAGDVLVDADRAGTLDVWAISGSGAGTAGFAGSIALNDAGGDTTARIGEAANVNASGNALVTAEADDLIKSKAGAVGLGGTLGAAGGIAFNDIHADTLAEVTGANTRVTALGNGAATQVDNGTLGGSGSLNAQQQKASVKGVAVVASSTAQVENYALSAAGGGSAAVAATVSIAMLGGSTTAQLADGARLNTSYGNAAQDARVAAYHHDTIESGTGGGAIGGDAGVGGAADTAVVSHVTTALIDNAQAQAQQGVVLDAASTTDITQAVIAVGGGVYAGLAGTVGVILLDGTTEALANDADLDSHGSLSIEATSDADIDLKAGALAVSGVAGVGITAAVTVAEQHTAARVGGQSDLAAYTSTTINAASTFEQDDYAYTAAAAGGVGIAGTVNVVVAKGSTDASVGSGVIVNADDGQFHSAQDVSVTASDNTRVDNKVGSLGIGLGGLGVGAVADVVLIHNGASASIASGAEVRADRDIAVRGSSVRNVDSISTAAAGGATAGIAGAVSVISVGARPEDDAADNTTGSVSKASELARASATGDQIGNNGGAAASNQRANAARAGLNVAQDFATAPASTSSAANVAAGATLNAGRHVEINAHTRTDTDAVAVGAAVSAGLSLGGGIAIAMVEDKTVAALDGNTTAGGNVSVTATDDQPDASVLRTYAGGGGVVGLAASFAWHEKSSTAAAELGGMVNAGGNVTVDAGIDHNLDSQGGTLSIGAVGIGAAIAYVTEDGDASAKVRDGAQITAAALDVHGHAQTDAAADVKAASGGLAAGVGADANTEDFSSASAHIGDGSVIRTLAGLTQVRASVDPNARANALGVVVSASVSIGVSLADATVATRAAASTGSNVDVEAAAMTVEAATQRHGMTAESDAKAGAGGLLLGASASDSNANVQTDTLAQTGNANRIVVSGEFKVDADSDTWADADVTGINIGVLAGGSSTSKATTNTTTRALVENDPDITAASVKVNADGNDTLRAKTVAGAGGLGVLVASKAETQATSQTTARLGGVAGNSGVVNAAQVDVNAAQHINFSTHSDSTSASVVGYSGARAINTINTDTRAVVGPNLTVNAEDFGAQAWNDIVKPSAGYNVDSGSGGLLNGAAASSTSTIRNSARVDIGHDAQINATKTGTQPVGSLNLAAWNEVEANDRVRLDSGGAIAIAKAESDIRADRNDAVVHVGDNATLLTDGDANLSARTDAAIHAVATSKTYGLAGAAEGDSEAIIRADNRIELAAGSKVETEGDLRLMAGTDGVKVNDLYADAETRLWNYTAFPVENDPAAHGEIDQNNRIDIADGAAARAVKSVYLLASEGEHRTRGFGEGTDAYRETLSAIGEFFGADTSSLKISGGSTADRSSSSVRVDGAAQAGIHHHQYLTFNADGSVQHSEGLSYTLEDGVSLSRELTNEIVRLRGIANDYRNDQPDIALAFDHDADILQAKLNELGGDTALVDFLRIGPVYAQAGNVRVTGDALAGSGALEAPGDVRIDIVNKSLRFLSTDTLTIPDEGGGDVTFNGVRVSSNDDINARNPHLPFTPPSTAAAFDSIIDASRSPDPVIHVENTNDHDVSGTLKAPPELHINGNVSNLRGSFIAKSHGTILSSANISAKTIDIATSGDFIQRFTFGFNHSGGDPIAQLGTLPGASEAAKTDYSGSIPARNCSAQGACSTIIAGNNVFISAERLNLNGIIQAGLEDRSMVIDPSLVSGVNAVKIANARSAYLANPTGADRYYDLFVADPGSASITVRYDAANDRLELGGVRFGGGHMELFGDIFSTGNGELRVLDGYGRINITNNTGYDLAMGRLDTGSGVEGMIRIFDTSQRGADNKPLLTEITRVGNTVTTRTSETLVDGKPATVTSSNAGRTSVFQPLANRRFNWVNGQKTHNREDRIYTTRVLFGVDDFYPDYNDPDTTTPGTPVYTPRAQGDWLSTDGAGKADYVLDYTNVTSGKYKVGDDYVISRTCIGISCDVAIYEDIKSGARYDWDVTETFHHSLNASKAVKISFLGHEAGDAGVTVNSPTGKVLLGDMVRSLADPLSITAPNGIEQLGDDARLVGNDIRLSAVNGAIGSSSAPLNIDLTDADAHGLVNGTVTATALSGVALKEISGDMRVVRVAAVNGDVMLTAERNLVGTGSGTVVSGNTLNLVSLSADIGSALTPLVVDTQGSTSTLSASAAGDIHLTEASGDMRVRQISSQGGDVSLAVPDGRLLDANTLEQVDESTQAELLALWDELALTGGAAESARDRNLANQSARLQQEYAAYFRMRNLHRLDDGSYTADAYNAGYQFHATPVQATVLKSVNGWNDADVANYEAGQTAAYHAAFQRFGGNDYVENFAPQLTATEVAALSSGAVWTEAQLTNALAAGLFRPVSDTDVRIEQANISGGNVTLNAAQGIGSVSTQPVVVVKGAALTNEQKLALLTAERSDLELVGNEIRIRQLEDVDVSASGQLRAAVQQGDALLGSESDLLIDSIAAPGEVRIKTGAAMQGVAGQTHITAGAAVLEAANGDLGSAASPLRVELPDTGTLTARAGGNLYVAEASGDMTIESVFAKGNVNLTAPGDIVEAREDRALDVRGGSVSLTAGDTVGRPGGDNALDVAIKAGGRIDASAPNGVYLNSTGASGDLGNINTQGDFSLGVIDGGITVVGQVQIGGNLDLGADDNIEFDGGSVNAGGDAYLQAGLDGAGSVLGDGVGGADVVAQGEMFIAARDAIGGATALEVQTDGDLRLQGRLIDVAMQPLTPGSAADLHVSGLNGTQAQNVNLAIRGADTATLHTLILGNGMIATEGSNLQIRQGNVGDHVTFSTPYFNARIDHLDRRPPPGMDVRGFTLDGDFDLELTPNVAHVGAYVINQNPLRIVFSNPAGYVDRINGESLRTQQSLSSFFIGVEGLAERASASDTLVTLAPGLLDEDAALKE